VTGTDDGDIDIHGRVGVQVMETDLRQINPDRWSVASGFTLASGSLFSSCV
jgi:hypothetical protein